MKPPTWMVLHLLGYDFFISKKFKILKVSQIGYIKLHRKLMENRFYFAEKFTKSQAWIDLLLLANFRDGYFEVRGMGVAVKRGQLAYSELSLAKRWKWSRNKTRSFLFRLETEHQIEQQKSNVTTLISIVNYESYQGDEPKEDNKRYTRKTPEGTHKKKGEKEENKDTIHGESDDSPDLSQSPVREESSGLNGKGDKEDTEQSDVKKPATEDDRYQEFIKHFNYLKKRETGTEGKFKGEEKSKRQFKVIRGKYSNEEIVAATKAMFNDQHHIDNGFMYATPELLTRPAKFEMFLQRV